MAAALHHPHTWRVVVMGVAGCGKTSVGAELARRIDGQFIDGDDLHPASNIEKMSAGIPLDDHDRMPWLSTIGEALSDAAHTHRTLVVACSALKRMYRDHIRAFAPDALFIHLQGPMDLLTERIESRSGHFMPASLLTSQFKTLEVLQAGERGLTVNVDKCIAQISDESVNWLNSLSNQRLRLSDRQALTP